MGRRFSGNGAGSPPRARLIAAVVPAQSGTLVTIGSQSLLAPVSYAKTAGAGNLSIAATTGAVSAAAAIVAGTSQTLNGTVTGADGCVIPFVLTASAAPGVPAAPSLTLTAGVGQITLAWSDAGDGGSPITAHKLYRGTSAGGEVLLGTILSGSPYIDSGLTAGQAYFYSLSAVNALGEGPLSAEQSATPANAATLTLASLSRPPLALTNFYNAVGDSMTFGVGTPISGGEYPAQLRTLITTDVVAGFHFGAVGGNVGTAIHKVGNGGLSGQNTQTITASVTGNLSAGGGAYAPENARTTFYMGSVNNYNNTISGWQRDWPAQVKSDTTTAAAAISGGDGLWTFLTIPENNRTAGMREGADHRFHFLDMVATRGRKVVDVARWLRMKRQLDGITPGTADDWAVNVMGHAPYSYRGGSHDFDGTVDLPWIASGTASAPTDLNQPEGTIGYTTSGVTYRKIGASGAGSWETVDIKHFSKTGYAAIARMAGDVAAAIEGVGPPFVPPARFRCALDAASGTIIGQVLPTGTVTQYALRHYDDTPVTEFAIDGSGNVTRTGMGTVTSGMTSLIVMAQNANGALASPLDIFVTRASTVTVPQMRTIAAPGIAITARDAHGMADGQKVSGAMWITTPPSGVQADYVLMARSTPGSTYPGTPLLLVINSAGLLQLTVYDSSANTSASNPTYRVNSTGTTIKANTTYWLCWSLDISTNTFVVYASDAAVTLGTPNYNTPGGALQLSECNPMFLAGSAPTESYNGTYNHTGNIGLLMFADGLIDWTNAANRRRLFNTDGTAVSRTAYAPFKDPGGNDVVPRFELWGDVGDWLWGSPDGSYGPRLLSVAHKANTLLS
jgi:hypothetical protein